MRKEHIPLFKNPRAPQVPNQELFAIRRQALRQLLSNIAYTFREDLGRRSDTMHHEVRRSLR